MGILERFSTIMKSNINALLDKAEDPAKLIDQYLRDAREDLAEVKKATAEVMANEKSAQRAVDECTDNIHRYEDAARNAVRAGNDADARTLLGKKQQFETQLAGLNQNLEVAKANSDKMRQMHDKLVGDIADLETRRDTVKAKVATAKAQETVNKMTGAGDKTGKTLDAFARMEAKADKMLDSATAMADLNESAARDDAADLAKKYAVNGASVDDELARLKAEIADKT